MSTTTFDDAKKLLAAFPRKAGGFYDWRNNPGKTAQLVALVMAAPKPRAFAEQLGAVVLFQAFAAGLTADGAAEWPELRDELKIRGIEPREVERRGAPSAQPAPEAPAAPPAPVKIRESACAHCGGAARWRPGIGAWVCSAPACGRSSVPDPDPVALRGLAYSILGGSADGLGHVADAALASEAGAAVKNLERLAGVPEGAPAAVAGLLGPPAVRRDVRALGADLVVVDQALLRYGTPAHRQALAELLRGLQIGGQAPAAEAPAEQPAGASEPS